MREFKLKKKLQDNLNDFVENLEKVYKDNFVSAILYGSASSGEFIDKHSNLNLLVILKNADLENLKKASGLINKWRFRLIHPLFFSEGYIRSSTDIFPIEFLDMKENYTLLAGQDILKDLPIDTRNLRFQCEQELKVKLIALRQFYLRRNKDKQALSIFLFKSFTSIMHILRNVLRIKGRQPPYLKQDTLKDITGEFQVDSNTWERILAAKNKEVKLSREEIEQLFINFVNDLEKIINFVDRF
jgi:predicted nucleotidyltransferase